jgi:hypothetical protein
MHACAQVVGSSKGKLELDISKIRARQAAVGSVYVPRGPHAMVSEHPGTGAAPAALLVDCVSAWCTTPTLVLWMLHNAGAHWHPWRDINH